MEGRPRPRRPDDCTPVATAVHTWWEFLALIGLAVIVLALVAKLPGSIKRRSSEDDRRREDD
jgi:hypothetical protein